MADDFSFSIEEHIGVVSQGKGGWQVELNLVSWSGREAKYDIRSWSPDHQKMGKGITMTKEELQTLGQIIGSL
ncbi:MAG: YdbC family protein [Spirochaetaceae bacterium]|nr:YdbC family protein [Spirochaetaceae bacterium]MBQ7366005.1 YdbC family protein [Spirochaetaceae bacterium]MBQ8560672.1 YdbC family protein [Spirochaetaceae bacterium]MBR2363160.1 YdbC family protein [Spirochaetaceae bacterium]MBR2462304.1 YdbC family protein [Spirochaetaceae bacterium]